MEPILKTSHSGEIKEFVAALAKAQGTMKPAVFNRVNPHYKSKYADFSACMDACRGPLSENGLAVVQYCEANEGKINLITMLAHVSGQWMKSEFPLISAKMDSQGIGSAMTYAKRYSLCGMVGIVADQEEDDDGEASVGRGKVVETLKSPASQLKTKDLAKPADKILPTQVAQINDLVNKLDTECKKKMYDWLKSSYNIDKIEDINIDNFQKAILAFQNAVKFMEQQKLEVAHA